MENNIISGDVDFTFNWVEFPFWYSVKNYEAISFDIIALYKEERNSIDEFITNPLDETQTIKNPLWIDVTNFIVNLESPNWPNPKTIDMLRANIKHGLRYNNTEIPKDLEYINKLIL